jgi:outer membrane protein TolC
LKDRKGLTKEARERLQKRVAALGEQLTGGFERVKIGKDSLADYLPALREWYETKIALADTREAERAVLENASRFLFVVEEQLAQLHQAGLQSYDSVLQAQAARAKVQSELEKRRGGR